MIRHCFAELSDLIRSGPPTGTRTRAHAPTRTHPQPHTRTRAHIHPPTHRHTHTHKSTQSMAGRILSKADTLCQTVHQTADMRGSSLMEAVDDVGFTCIVCYGTDLHTPSVCENGHIVCKACSLRIEDSCCPVCRSSSGFHEVPELGTFLQKLIPVQCHACVERGCGNLMSLYELTHVHSTTECPYRYVQCPVLGCMQMVEFCNLGEHIQSTADKHLSLRSASAPCMNSQMVC